MVMKPANQDCFFSPGNCNSFSIIKKEHTFFTRVVLIYVMDVYQVRTVYPYKRLKFGVFLKPAQ
jgi:hypothetical protein